jgi:hypothetical protein
MHNRKESTLSARHSRSFLETHAHKVPTMDNDNPDNDRPPRPTNETAFSLHEHAQVEATGARPSAWVRSVN